MAEPYGGQNLGPLQQRSGASNEDWSDNPEVSKAKKEDWSDHPAKGDLSLGDIGKDVVKSGGIGLAKGTLGLAGLPGDLTDLGAKGIKAASDFISNKIGVTPYEPTQESALHNIPTGASLQKNVEGVTGDFYKPQTTPGHYAETVGEFLPAAVAGPGGIARKVALQAVVPGVASEAAGQATAGTPLEPYARAAAGITAGVGGALLTQPSQAGQIIRQQFAEAGVTPKIVEDARKLMNSGVKLSWPEAISKAAGSPVLTDKLRALESDPITSAKMAKFFSDRPQQVHAAGQKAFSEIGPAPADPYVTGSQVGKAGQAVVKDVKDEINKISKPYYDAAEAVTLSPAEMSHVRAIPNWTEARDAVRDGENAWLVEHLPDESVGFLNQVKKYFDQAAENSSSKFNPKKNRESQSTYESAASALKQIGELKSADYGHALAIQQAGREQVLEPLLQGPIGQLAKKDVTTRKAIEALFPSDPLANSEKVIGVAVKALAEKHPGAAIQLVRAHVEKTFNEATQSLMGGPAQWGGAKFAAILTGNPQQKQNLRAAMEALPNGKDIWRGTEGFLDAMEAIGTRQAKGSLTAFNPDQLKSLSASNFVGSAARLGASPGKWLKAIDEVWAGINKGKNMNTLADILTDPKSVPLLKRIAAMPTGSREAGYVAARLILQSENAGVQPREARRQ